MSQFWDAGDPPAELMAATYAQTSAAIRWVEESVEQACRESWESAEIVQTHHKPERVPVSDGLMLTILLNTPWDETIEHSTIGVCKLMRDAARDLTYSGPNPSKRGIYKDQYRDDLEARLKAMEDTIAEIRAAFREGKFND